MLGLFRMFAQGPGPALTKEDLQKAFLVDVRTPAEFAAGSAPGAVNIPLDQVLSRIGEFRNKEKIVVFCRSGSRSARAKEILESHGITNVINGGSWQNVAEALKK
ncbi:MAG: rhodanese-like domain-containing protein [Flavobacteriales bacterium]|nr:rhodanese-like domain-containing protein [Flavobacteriales bacterium]MDW8409397.1 rhodanese-like domain-containing protein [Flavobacteriales bacterium]